MDTVGQRSFINVGKFFIRPPFYQTQNSTCVRAEVDSMLWETIILSFFSCKVIPPEHLSFALDAVEIKQRL